MNVDEVVGAVLRELREDLGWSRADAERASGDTVRRSVLGMYERGERSVLLPVFFRLADLYQVGTRHLIAVIEERVRLAAAA